MPEMIIMPVEELKGEDAVKRIREAIRRRNEVKIVGGLGDDAPGQGNIVTTIKPYNPLHKQFEDPEAILKTGLFDDDGRHIYNCFIRGKNHHSIYPWTWKHPDVTDELRKKIELGTKELARQDRKMNPSHDVSQPSAHVDTGLEDDGMELD